MLGRIFATAIVAGALAGVFVWGAHIVKVTPLILAAEVYEDAAAENAAGTDEKGVTAPADAAETHTWAPGNGFERNAYTLLTDLIAGVGFALVLTGLIALSGREVDIAKGVYWGLAGFASVYAFPALGLSPEIPGMQAAPLAERQIWWVATVAASAVGIGLVFLSRKAIAKVAGVALLAAPHLVGAPHVTPESSAIPVELGAQFAAASLVITWLFWMLLGGLTGYFWNRFSRS